MTDDVYHAMVRAKRLGFGAGTMVSANGELCQGDLQDGMLAYYLSQVGQADANVENRVEREAFDYLEMIERRATPLRR